MGMSSMIFLAAKLENTNSFGFAITNTIMGITIVFLMLLLISAIISQFKHISKLEDKFIKKAVIEPPAAPVIPSAPIEVEEEEEELADDLELAAVITAAIHAYEEEQGNEVPADGLVVRSIRKVNKSRWQNA